MTSPSRLELLISEVVSLKREEGKIREKIKIFEDEIKELKKNVNKAFIGEERA